MLPFTASNGGNMASTDVSVEGVHFDRAWLSFEEIGWRATAAALSDLAADQLLHAMTARRVRAHQVASHGRRAAAVIDGSDLPDRE